MRPALVASLIISVSGCFLIHDSKSKDPLANATLTVQTYTTDTSTSTSSEITGMAGDSYSNRPIALTLNNVGTADVTKVTLVREINGTSTSCDLLDQDGKPFFHQSIEEWAGVSTKYTLTIATAASSKTFGPYDITVKPANLVVSSHQAFGDQTNDTTGSYGPYFQSKSVDIGFGGYNGANMDSVLAQYRPRKVSFAFLTEGTQLKAVSPDLMKGIYSPDRLKNDCGYLTTTFAAYTGTLDPDVTALTLTEVQGLPDPPAGAAKLDLNAGTKFVFKTSEGMKGLVHVKTISGTTVKTIDTAYSAQQ